MSSTISRCPPITQALFLPVRRLKRWASSGFTADYTYDYTCMETLQGLSAAELTTTEGRKWRTAYSDPASTARVGLDDAVWPGAFERMAQFIQDTHLTADDLALNYDDVTGMFRNGEVAMYFGSSAGVKMFQDEGIDTIFHALLQPERRKVDHDHPVFPSCAEP